jgi:hypothetical protein
MVVRQSLNALGTLSFAVTWRAGLRESLRGEQATPLAMFVIATN